MTEFFNLPWWGWIVFGVLLALLEISSPGGFYFIFFGVSAVLVGALTWLDLTTEPWLQVTFFSIFAILASLFFRKPLLARFSPHMPDIPVDSMIGEIGTAIDIPEQVCITRDNVQVAVDGVLYMKVLNPERASYGIQDYTFAITQLAQTTLRSEVGKIELDRTFEERTNINISVVSELDKASEAWGVKVMRYEIKNITPPKDVLAAMEKQMRAEREKRAVILTSEGVRDAAVNTAEGQKQQVIKASEANKQQQINEAEGQAAAILTVAVATAEGIRKIAESIQAPGGFEAVQLRVAEQYITQFGSLARESTTLVMPATVSDVGSMLALAMNVIRKGSPNGTAKT